MGRLMSEVAIVGVGWSGFRSITPDLSFREMMFEAAAMAYADAGIHPRRDLDGLVTAEEDFHEGVAISNEYVPDQMGAVLKSVHTIAGDGLQALAEGVMQIAAGAARILAVESHSKASNVRNLSQITALAMDPVFQRPLDAHPLFIAGLEMRRYLEATRTPLEHVAWVAAKNRRNAMRNPRAAFPADLSVADVLSSEPLAEPLTRLMAAEPADGCVVVVLARGDIARSLTDRAVWIRGIGWATDSYTLEGRDWEGARYLCRAAEIAYQQARIRSPRRAFDLVEVDDTFAYKELQHLEALGLCRPGEAGWWTAEGATEIDGELPVNPSGGCLGEGRLLEASGLARLLEAVLQLRGEAGPRQIPRARTALVASWRGLPTATGAVAILSREA
jgi:acetyl-CoA C-acetyltransferase